MKKSIVALLSVLSVTMSGQLSISVARGAADMGQYAGQVDSNANSSPELGQFIKTVLLPLGADPVFVKAVEAQNAKGVTLDKIKEIDKEWQAAEDELPIHKELMSNDCAKEIVRLATMIPAIGETFVMDNQGANVGQNALTSDYWQGDEPKWEKSYNAGKGGIDVSEEKLDKSTNIVDQKVSVPVLNDKGEVIGAICFGLNKEYAQALGRVIAQMNGSAASDKVKGYVLTNLLTVCTNPVFAKSIEAQNGKGVTLDKIKEIDKEWQAAEDELAIHKELMGNDCAKEVIRIAGLNKAVVEVFVMDNQGANVGQNALTSDYWQGDEPKWQKSYNEGKGGADVGEVKLDKSANIQLQQVSLPVINASGKVVGAICMGLNTDIVNSTDIAGNWSVVSK